MGTINDNGYPNIHPTRCYFDSVNKKIYLETSKVSKKIDNLRKNNSLYFCIDDLNPPYKGVKGRCICRIHYDINHNLRIAKKNNDNTLRKHATYGTKVNFLRKKW